MTGEADRQVGLPEDVVDSFDQNPVMMVATEGPDLIIRAMNSVVRGVYGKPDPIGQRLHEYAPGLFGQDIFELFARCYTTGETVVRSGWRVQADPADPASEFFVNMVISPWRRPDGSIRGVTTYAIDVTHQVRARLDSEARAAGAEQRLAEAQQIVLELQRNLLPDAVPVLPCARLAAHYVVAASELHAGGDWFDAIPTRDGRVALVIGDVVGHGAAAAAMAQLRTVLREALLSGAPVAQAVDRLDRFAATSPTTRAATVCVAELDPASGKLTWTSRAHPPPLVCAPDGSTRFLDTGRGTALGVDPAPTQPATATLVPGEVVLLYSDGLVERPGATIADGLARLARIAGSAVATRSPSLSAAPADRICELTVERVTREEFADDITVLAAHLLPDAATPLEVRVPAEPARLAGVRVRVDTWLSDLVADREDQVAVTLAVYEAAANVVDHAYRGRARGELRVSVTLADDGTLTAVVADDGRWRGPHNGGGGRGLALIRACADLDLERRDDGTTATIRRRLGHPAVVGSTGPATQVGRLRDDAFDAAITRRDPDVLTVRGPVDVGTVGLLSAEIAKHGAGPLLLDLTPVTFLGSVGIQLLHDLTRRRDLSFFAPPGSPAREVLTLVGLGGLLTPDQE